MPNRLIFDTIPELVKKNKFLPVDSSFGKYFSGTDTPELFAYNLKVQPEDWYYRHAPVRYTLNRQGYRTAEFNTIDWGNSIVIFGCSNVFGVGVDDKYTLATQLSELVNKPVINMGVGGGSITFSLHNAIILRDHYPTPLAVINLWTDYSRTVYYHKKKVTACGSWNIETNNYMHSWAAEDSHGKTHAIFASKTSKLLWENTKYFEGSYFNQTAQLLSCKLMDHKEDARDGLHYGNSTHHRSAVTIAEILKL
jgi:hypothetical protein